MNDLISRRAAIDALWKSLYEYEDKTEQQFQESEDLDVGVWIGHRIFVQNMNDLDRQTILNLPSYNLAIEAIAKMEAIQKIIDMPFEWEQDDRCRYSKIVDIIRKDLSQEVE